MAKLGITPFPQCRTDVPVSDLSILRDQLFAPFEQVFDNFFDNFWKSPVLDRAKSFTGYPKLDIGMENGDFVVRATVPGIAPENVSVAIKDRTVRISGSNTYKSPENSQYFVREISRRAFVREFTLPDNIPDKDPEATIKDGILVLRWELPKEVTSKEAPRNIPIKRE
jgi:HSP20 family protein